MRSGAFFRPSSVDNRGMLFLLSPAKSLDYDSPVPAGLPATQPQFVPQSKSLITVLRRQSPQQIAELMSLSDKLSVLNAARYKAWSPTFTVLSACRSCTAPSKVQSGFGSSETLW